MTMITPSYLGDALEYSSYASSLVPSSDPLVTAASVLEFRLALASYQMLRQSRMILTTCANTNKMFGENIESNNNTHDKVTLAALTNLHISHKREY